MKILSSIACPRRAGGDAVAATRVNESARFPMAMRHNLDRVLTTGALPRSLVMFVFVPLIASSAINHR
jgi:hypothetical protein